MERTSLPRRIVCLQVFITSLLLTGIPARGQTQDQAPRREFKLFGGLGQPVGDFGVSPEPQAGLAETGLALGVEMCSEVVSHFQIGVGGTFNLHSADFSYIEAQLQGGYPGIRVSPGTWKLYWFNALVGFETPLSDDVDFYGHGHLGVLIANSPDVTVYTGSGYGHANGVNGNSLGYGFTFGAIFADRFDAGLRYLTGEPEFNVNGVSGKQTISVLNVTVGYVFR